MDALESALSIGLWTTHVRPSTGSMIHANPMNNILIYIVFHCIRRGSSQAFGIARLQPLSSPAHILITMRSNFSWRSR